MRSRSLVRRHLLYCLLLMVCGIGPVLTGCAAERTATLPAGVKPVKVMEVTEETFPVQMEYIGTVQAKELKKYSLELSGKIGDVLVTEGQEIKKGQELVRLDAREIELAVEAASNNREKARRAYQFARDHFERMQALLAAGAVSRQETDQAKLELDLNEASYHNARLDFENKNNLLGNTVIKADMDGYAAAVSVKEGEVAAAGYPVVVVRSSEMTVRVGVTQQDFGKIAPGMAAQVSIEGQESAGKVVKINQVPDIQTKTYQIEISMDHDNAPLGATARVVLESGEEKGVFIPITSILKSDRDYVFIITDERAVKKSITLGKTRGSGVVAQGLSAGDQLVVEGMKKLEDGDRVTVQP